MPDKISLFNYRCALDLMALSQMPPRLQLGDLTLYISSLFGSIQRLRPLAGLLFLQALQLLNELLIANVLPGNDQLKKSVLPGVNRGRRL